MKTLDSRLRGNDRPYFVVSAKAGTHVFPMKTLDSRLRGNDRPYFVVSAKAGTQRLSDEDPGFPPARE
jgi:hypothetical protein